MPNFSSPSQTAPGQMRENHLGGGTPSARENIQLRGQVIRLEVYFHDCATLRYWISESGWITNTQT